MKNIGELYRSGIWTVKPGKVEEFIKAWQTSVEWLAANHPSGWGGEALLLQDIASSYKFISFAWSTMPEKTEELLAGMEFQSFMTSIRELCEEIQPHRMRVVGYSTSHLPHNRRKEDTCAQPNRVHQPQSNKGGQGRRL